jgi:hypothetical protein
MAKDSGAAGTIITVVVVGGVAYLLYTWYSASATAAASSATTATGTTTPSPTQAGTTPATTTPSTTTAAPLHPLLPQRPTSPSTSGGSLDATYTQLIQVATANAPATGIGVNLIQLVSGQPQMTFSAWNYYLAQITGISDLPDYQTVAGVPDPNTAITGPAYWALMAPWLQANAGMSGLGIFGGLGALAMQAKRGESRWKW